MAAQSTPSYAKDILPLFTSTDIAHMKPLRVFLDQYNWMKVPANAQNVYNMTSQGKMPPASAGGPWPPANVTLFKAWIDGGYQP